MTPADATASTLPALQGTVTGRLRFPAPVMEVGTYQTGPTIIRTGAPVTTMSSREIAELTGKRHDHVMRDIRVMLVELHGEGGLPKFGDTYRDPQNGQLYPCFLLPKDLTITLVSGYNVTMRHRIVTRWMELEEAAKPAAPVTTSTCCGASAGCWLSCSARVGVQAILLTPAKRPGVPHLQIDASKFASAYVDAKGEKRSACYLETSKSVSCGSSVSPGKGLARASKTA